MKRSEKLLDAIGQIDDRLVEEAGRALADIKEDEKALRESPGAAAERRSVRTRKRKGKSNERKNGRAALYRWQGALAACAVIAVCAGIFGILERSGVVLAPYGEKAETAAETAAEATAETAAEATAEIMAEAAAEAMPEAVSGAADQSGMVSAAAPDQAQKESGGSTRRSASGADANNAAVTDSEAEKKLADEIRSLSEASEESLLMPEEAEDLTDQILISVKEGSAESVTFIMENAADETVCYGAEYELEQLVGESWQLLQPKKELVWEAVGYYINPGKSSEITENFGNIYGRLQAGQYRLIKRCWTESDEGSQDQKEYPVYVEFTVTE